MPQNVCSTSLLPPYSEFFRAPFLTAFMQSQALKAIYNGAQKNKYRHKWAKESVHYTPIYAFVCVCTRVQSRMYSTGIPVELHDLPTRLSRRIKPACASICSAGTTRAGTKREPPNNLTAHTKAAAGTASSLRCKYSSSRGF